MKYILRKINNKNIIFDDSNVNTFKKLKEIIIKKYLIRIILKKNYIRWSIFVGDFCVSYHFLDILPHLKNKSKCEVVRSFADFDRNIDKFESIRYRFS